MTSEGSKFPVTFVELSDEEKATVAMSYGEQSTLKDLVRTQPRLVTLAKSFNINMERILDIKLRPSDVWVVTPPKCGTTWLQEMSWLIMNNADVEGTSQPLFERTPFIDMPMLMNMNKEEVDQYFDALEARPSPRLIKSHLPFELLPPNLVNECKVIFCSRNVKDAAVSFYHHERLIKVHDLLLENFETYARGIYKPGLNIYGGYFDMLESGWKRKDHPNVLFLWYEEVKKDQKKIIKDIMKHIDQKLTEEQIDTIDESMKFDNYKKKSSMTKPNNPMLHEGRGQFVRKGIVGDHVNYFSEDLNKEWDQWISSNLERIGVTESRIVNYFNTH